MIPLGTANAAPQPVFSLPDNGAAARPMVPVPFVPVPAGNAIPLALPTLTGFLHPVSA